MQKQELENWLKDRIAGEIGLNTDQVDSEVPLISYLMSGFQSFRVVAELEMVAGKRVPDSVLYMRPTIAELAEHLSGSATKKRQFVTLSVLAGA